MLGAELVANIFREHQRADADQEISETLAGGEDFGRRAEAVVLDEADDDLQHGREFYDLQEPGVGDYFAASLAADIDSLILYAGI